MYYERVTWKHRFVRQMESTESDNSMYIHVKTYLKDLHPQKVSSCILSPRSLQKPFKSRGLSRKARDEWLKMSDSGEILTSNNSMRGQS